MSAAAADDCHRDSKSASAPQHWHLPVRGIARSSALNTPRYQVAVGPTRLSVVLVATFRLAYDVQVDGSAIGRGGVKVSAEEFQRHALTLTLLGNFIRRAHGGDIRKWREIDLHRADEKQGGHAFRVIDAYVRWLG